MNPSRRRFASTALLGAGAALVAPAAFGQASPSAPAEGVQYVRLAEPAPVAVAPGRIEVIEFFWYECPHCNAFEPALETWVKRQPDDVAFRRVPVWFREEPFGPQQRLYYAIEALDLVPTLHRKVFSAIHAERTRLRTPEDLAAFALKSGVDPMRLMAAYASPAVQAKALQARQLASAYKIDAVPAMGVHGRYYTNGTLANAGIARGRIENMLDVVDALVGRIRHGGRA